MNGLAFEYRVCQAQESRVTFVNGVWTGRLAVSAGVAEALASCPQTWEYLGEAGAEGWELVSTAVITRPDASLMYLFLRREVPARGHPGRPG